MLRTHYRWLLLQNSNYAKCSHGKNATYPQTSECVNSPSYNSETAGLIIPLYYKLQICWYHPTRNCMSAESTRKSKPANWCHCTRKCTSSNWNYSTRNCISGNWYDSTRNRMSVNSHHSTRNCKSPKWKHSTPDCSSVNW